MSLILAFLSTAVGVMASDGRRFSPATFNNSGDIITPAKVETDECDKTFEIRSAEIIGAYCGLMDFSGKSSGDHIVDAVKSTATRSLALNELVDGVKVYMETALNNINPQEVLVRCRKLDILLIGRVKPNKPHMQIAAIRFTPNGAGVTSSYEFRTPTKEKVFCLFGNDAAQAAASRVLESNKASNHDSSFMNSLAKQAMAAGVVSATVHEYGSEISCGGKIHRRRYPFPK